MCGACIHFKGHHSGGQHKSITISRYIDDMLLPITLLDRGKGLHEKAQEVCTVLPLGGTARIVAGHSAKNTKPWSRL